MMTKYLLVITFMTGLMSPLTAAAQASDIQENDVQAGVAISVQRQQNIWAGQQVTLDLDIKTTGFSFSNSHFNLPEVSGAFLMQTDTTTIKLTENIDGQTWQIIRYPLALYPQKAGQLEVPPISVRFTTSAGFGSTEKAFEFQTQPLVLTINQPPGVKDGDLVITTTSFKLDHDWQPQSGTAKTGDAITLTVTRSASDISAMLLPPLPVYRTAGLAAYPQAPEVNDNTNRGDLTGQRTDSTIWVVEKPGSYEIPGIRFQWWDPGSRELKQQIIPGLTLDIPPSPTDSATENNSDQPVQSRKIVLRWLITLLTSIAVTYLWLRFGRRTKKLPTDTEKSVFASLQKACASNDPGQTLTTLHEWLVYQTPVRSPSAGQLTLSEFAKACDDTQLADEFTLLQESLISSDSHWQGNHLSQLLRHNRAVLIRQQAVRSTTRLAPLNP